MTDTSSPPVVEVLNEAGTSRCVLICEHASHYIPTHYGNLGLSQSDLSRHIAWDIGAIDVARQLSSLFDAPLAYSNYSRLLIDLNRPVSSVTSIPEISETTRIPGNSVVDTYERQHRIRTYFEPFHARVSALLDARCQSTNPPVIITIHSFTPVFDGVTRPWHAGVLFRKSTTLGRSLVAALNDGDCLAAENEPYQIEDDGDDTVPVH